MIPEVKCDWFLFLELNIHRGTCSSNDPRFEIGTSVTSLPSDVIADSSCATSSLTLTARQGQRLNVTIVDYKHDVTSDPRFCENYLQLVDVTSEATTQVCAGSERVRHIMTSTGSELRVAFQLHNARNQRFLLQVQG